MKLFKVGQRVYCAGEAQEVFTIQELSMRGEQIAALHTSRGYFHGWEPTRKLTDADGAEAFLTRVLSQDSPKAQLHVVNSTLAEWISTDRFDLCNEALQKVDPKDFLGSTLLGFLLATQEHQSKLPEWNRLKLRILSTHGLVWLTESLAWR